MSNLHNRLDHTGIWASKGHQGGSQIGNILLLHSESRGSEFLNSSVSDFNWTSNDSFTSINSSLSLLYLQKLSSNFWDISDINKDHSEDLYSSDLASSVHESGHVLCNVVTIIYETRFVGVGSGRSVSEFGAHASNDILSLVVDERMEVLYVVFCFNRVGDHIVDDWRYVHGRSSWVWHRRSTHLHCTDCQRKSFSFSLTRHLEMKALCSFDSDYLSKGCNDHSLHRLYKKDSTTAQEAGRN